MSRTNDVNIAMQYAKSGVDGVHLMDSHKATIGWVADTLAAEVERLEAGLVKANEAARATMYAIDERAFLAECAEKSEKRAEAAEARVKELEAQNARLRAALEWWRGLRDESRGVAGYHLNGDIAYWGEFEDPTDAALNGGEAIHCADCDWTFPCWQTGEGCRKLNGEEAST